MATTTGLLLVHGIGSQSRASVLTSSCDALVTWLRHRHGEDAVTFGPTSLRLGEDSSDGPPAARLHLPDDTTWLIAESRWAESFIAPSFQRITGWTLAAVLRAVRLEAGYLLGPNKVTEPEDDNGRLAPARPYPTTRAFRYVKGMLVLAALPVVLAALATTSILRLLPPLRDRVIRIQSVLSATIGDSFVFATGGSGRAAIVQQVRRDIEWMHAQRVDRIVVAAHSQGAAVTYEALDQWECPRLVPDSRPCLCSVTKVDLLTYGSGLDKLNALHDAGPTRFLSSIYALLIGLIGAAAVGFTGLAVVDVVTEGAYSPKNLALTLGGVTAIFIGVTAIAWLVSLFRPLGWIKRGWTAAKNVILLGGPLFVLGLLLFFSPAPALPGILFALGAGLLALGLMVDASEDEAVTVPAMARSWIDVRSTSDPVASSSTITPVGRIDLVVHNLRSAVYDHTSYWDNWSEFVPIVINVMSPQQGSLAVPRLWTLRERSRRFEWTWVLAGNRATFTILSFAAVVWALTSLSAIGSWATERYRLVMDVLGNEVAPITSTPVLTLLGIGVVVLVFVVGYQLLAAGWHTWQRLTARRQVTQLELIKRRRDEWPRWRAVSPCRRRDLGPPVHGWLVLKQVESGSELWWLGGEHAEDDGCVLKGVPRVRPWWGGGLSIRVGTGRFTSRSLRSVAHLCRTLENPGFR